MRDRDLRILCGIGVLGAAAWTMTAVAQGQGRGSNPASQGQGNLEGPLRPVGGFMGRRGMVIPTPPQLEQRSLLFFGEPETGPAPPGMPMGVLEAGGTDHPLVPAIHLLGDASDQVEADQAATPQPAAPGGVADTDQAASATAQPGPAASPSSPRPPGAFGPGLRVSGRPGPGRPGPGQPTRPRG